MLPDLIPSSHFNALMSAFSVMRFAVCAMPIISHLPTFTTSHFQLVPLGAMPSALRSSFPTFSPSFFPPSDFRSHLPKSLLLIFDFIEQGEIRFLADPPDTPDQNAQMLKLTGHIVGASAKFNTYHPIVLGHLPKLVKDFEKLITRRAVLTRHRLLYFDQLYNLHL